MELIKGAIVEITGPLQVAADLGSSKVSVYFREERDGTRFVVNEGADPEGDVVIESIESGLEQYIAASSVTPVE
ncbi:hypothetical protein [Prescottella equi]